MRFSYRAYDAGGRRTAGVIDAVSRDAAIDHLSLRGEVPVDVAPAQSALELPWWQKDLFSRAALSSSELQLFMRELSTLCGAHVAIDDALHILAGQAVVSGRSRVLAKALLAAVVDGRSLSQAMAEQGALFSELQIELIRAGETSANLGGSLDQVAGLLERANALRSRLRAALAYPAVLLITAVAVIVLLATVLVPAIAPLYTDAGSTPPFVISALQAANEAVSAQPVLWVVACVGFAIGAVALVRAPATRALLQRWGMAVPLFASFTQQRETGLWARTLGVLLRSGLPLLEALRLTRGIARNSLYAEAVEGMTADVAQGVRLSQALARTKLFSDLTVRLTAVGEHTGELDAMLLRIADIQDAVLERRLSRLTTLAAPILTLLIGGFVGGLIVTVMSAVLGVNEVAFQ